MYYEKPAYYIILKKRRQNYEILYNIGGESSVTTVLRLNGKNANIIFRGIINALARQGAVIPSRISEHEQVYSIREDLGPVVGGYLILIRKARNIKKWNSFFNDMLNGQYVGVAKALSLFLELAIELSKTVPRKSIKKTYALSPVIVEALSSSLKLFANKMIKFRERKAS